MLVEDFKQLRVYRSAFEGADQIFRVSGGWPKSEQYALTDQIRRSSRSVCANIAEAWFKRKYPRHFASKLSDAGSEAAETIVWIDIAAHCGYLTREDSSDLEQRYRRVSGSLVKMMTEPDRWCIPDSTVREEVADYDDYTETEYLDT